MELSLTPETTLFVCFAVLAFVMNVLAYLLFRADKCRAQRDARRISERSLLLVAFFGGAFGALVGMVRQHHKTRKWKFRILVPLFLLLQLVVGCAFVALNVYAADYYHADERALAALESTDDVRVDHGRDVWFFDGPGTKAAYVFYPGAKVETEAYAPLMQRIAREGVDCYLVDMPYHLAFFGIGRAGDIRSQEMKDYEADGHNPQDYERWYLGGHSLGGVVASMEPSLESFDGLILLASYPSADQPKTDFRSLSVYGSNDTVLNRESYEDAKRFLPDDATEMVLVDGNHAQFGDYGEQMGDGEATISPERQQAETAKAIAAFAR
jgi:uncharacterized membrane protein YsdA (DUF1294 family)/pimeloyl-ACP methyl ester carboxylesterase